VARTSVDKVHRPSDALTVADVDRGVRFNLFKDGCGHPFTGRFVSKPFLRGGETFVSFVLDGGIEIFNKRARFFGLKRCLDGEWSETYMTKQLSA